MLLSTAYLVACAPSSSATSAPAPELVDASHREQQTGEDDKTPASPSSASDDALANGGSAAGPDSAEPGQSVGFGGVGSRGTGRGGGGSGEGTIGLGNVGNLGADSGGEFGARAPRVKPGESETSDSIDKDVIRRIVRAHLNEVRYCYSKGLASNPDLKGRVMVKFKIAPTGSVVESEVDSQTLGDDTVASCISEAVKRWEFPKPAGGGDVVVSYPFVLSPG